MAKPVRMFANLNRELLKGDLRRLRTGTVKVWIHLDTHRVSAAVVRLAPEARFALLRRQSARLLAGLSKVAQALQWSVRSTAGSGIATEVIARVPVKRLGAIARCAGVRTIDVSIRHPRHRELALAERWSWFCVRERVAIQVESQRRGHQTVEDRFLLVRARSAEAAERRAKEEAREYGRPYLNSDGRLVRWHVEAITAVNYVLDRGFQPEGTEVFSELNRRRLKRSWNPRRSFRTD